MSIYQRNRTTVNALVDRKVSPLGVRDRWASVCCGERTNVAIREAVSYAVSRTDKRAEGQREDQR